MPSRLFSNTQEAQIRTAYESGDTSFQLAEKWGCQFGTILRIVKRVGGKIRRERRLFSKELERQIRKEYDSGTPVAHLAKKWRRCPTTILRSVKRAGGKPTRRLFSDKQEAQIRTEYESGFRSPQLAQTWGCSGATILNTIKRAGGKIRPSSHGKSEMFSNKQKAQIRTEYESGFTSTQLASEWGCTRRTILVVIKRAGGKIRTWQKYFQNPIRERHLQAFYGLAYEDVLFFYKKQKGACLWCMAYLPQDALKCVIDHIGGEKGLHNKNNVRGLACPDGICNLIAGKIEKNHIKKKDWGLNALFVKHIKHVIKTNKGHHFE